MSKRSAVNMFALLLLLLSATLQAQKKNDAEAVRKFVKCIALMRQAPVSATMTLESHADVNNVPEDNYSMSGSFSIQENAIYIRMGETEQLMNDSVAIMVSNETKQIVLKETNGNAGNPQLPGLQWSGQEESTVNALKKQYAAVANEDGVLMTSRALLTGTKMPRETVQLKMNRQNGFPEEVLVIRKKMVVMDSAQMVQVRDEQQIPAERFMQSEGVYRVIKEITIKIMYGPVNKENNQIPVKVEERLRKEPGGEWTPAQAYADYRVINQNNNN